MTVFRDKCTSFLPPLFFKKQTKACTNWRISLRFNIRRCMKTMETFESCFNVEILSCFLHFLINFFFQSYSIYHLFTKRENLRLRMFIGCGVVFFQQVCIVLGPDFFGAKKMQFFDDC